MQRSDHPAHVVRFHHGDDDSRGSFSEVLVPTGASGVSVQLMPLGSSAMGSPAGQADGSSSAMPSPVAPSPSAGAGTLAQRRPLVAPDATQSRPAESTTKEKFKMIGQTCSYLMFVLYPTIVGILMGLYYLYAKFGDESVWAFAVIWLIFVVAMTIGLIYSWRQRAKEARLLAAEQASGASGGKHTAVSMQQHENKSA